MSTTGKELKNLRTPAVNRCITLGKVMEQVPNRNK